MGKKWLDFMVLEEDQFTRCTKTQTIICPVTLSFFSSSTLSCELGIYSGKNDHCERMVLPPQRSPVFRRIGGDWLYSTDLPVQVGVHCSSSADSPQTLVTISGTGSLQGYGGCDVQCNGIRMLGKVVGETHISLPQGGVHQPIITALGSPNATLTTATEREFLTANTKALDALVATLPGSSVGMSLQAAIHVLEKDSEQARLHQSHTIRGWVSAGLSSASLLAVAALLITCCMTALRAK
uniref:Uncharacterized protein n=1 Tax=Lygus hesperus TaxID=30085 RepID=A0A0K8T717_LYGHE